MRSDITVGFFGCSFTVGEGFDPDQRHLVYDRLLEHDFGFKRRNFAQIGASNHLIFMKACQMIDSDIDLLIVQWSALHRLWLYPGPDACFFVNDGSRTFAYRDIFISKTDIIKLRDQLQILNHDYHNILELIEYCRILCWLADYHEKQIVFVNGLVPWTRDLLYPLDTADIGSSLSPYTKALLDFGYLADDIIVKFFNRLRDKFLTLDQTRWANLFDSFQSMLIDTGPQGHHPGPGSHRSMADTIARYLRENGLILGS